MVLNDRGKQIKGAGWGTASDIDSGEFNHATTAIIHKTKKIAFAFAYHAKEKARESVAINGKVLGDNEPRVFIVNLDAKEPELKPIDVELPKAAPDFTSRDAAKNGAAWRKMVDELTRSSPDIKKLMDAYAKK